MSDNLQFFMHKNSYYLGLQNITHHVCTLEQAVLRFAYEYISNYDGRSIVNHTGVLYVISPNEDKKPKLVTQKQRRKIYEELKSKDTVPVVADDTVK